MRTRRLLIGLLVAASLCQLGSVTYIAWLEEDVHWIITPQEAAAFRSLKNDQERDNFVEQFWLRCDPTPDTIENEFKEEHYRRLAYSNQHFAAEKPGWAMDRGHFYIVFGPPDRIGRALEDGIPIEVWSYRYLEGIGQEKSFKFLDSCKCGRFNLEGKFPEPNTEHGNEIFERLSNVSASHSPSIRFKNLSELASHRIRYDMLPFGASAGFQSATHAATVTNLTVSIPRASVPVKENERGGARWINVYGQVTSLSGHIVGIFEEVLNASDQKNIREELESKSSLALRPGSYQVYVAIQDESDPTHLGTRQWTLKVPTFEELDRVGLKPVKTQTH